MSSTQFKQFMNQIKEHNWGQMCVNYDHFGFQRPHANIFWILNSYRTERNMQMFINNGHFCAVSMVVFCCELRLFNFQICPFYVDYLAKTIENSYEISPKKLNLFPVLVFSFARSSFPFNRNLSFMGQINGNSFAQIAANYE